jgi:ABC-2 type transport system permease protein
MAMRALRSEVAFIAAYVRANLRTALEYRVAFWTNVLAMALNDAMWVIFWAVFFTRFPEVRGYDLRDVLTIWAVAALGFGVATGIFGNCLRLAPLIAEGRLDFYLLLPRSPLLHTLVSRMSISAWGDALFGVILYLIIARPGPGEVAAFFVVSLAAGLVIVAHATMANCLAFWLGNAEGVAQQAMNALIMFSTYPTTLFNTIVRVLLFTIVPAGFIAYVPVRFLREWEPWQLGAMLAAATLYTSATFWVFGRGLRRYESGNLVSMRT